MTTAEPERDAPDSTRVAEERSFPNVRRRNNRRSLTASVLSRQRRLSRPCRSRRATEACVGCRRRVARTVSCNHAVGVPRGPEHRRVRRRRGTGRTDERAIPIDIVAGDADVVRGCRPGQIHLRRRHGDGADVQWRTGCLPVWRRALHQHPVPITVLVVAWGRERQGTGVRKWRTRDRHERDVARTVTARRDRTVQTRQIDGEGSAARHVGHRKATIGRSASRQVVVRIHAAACRERAVAGRHQNMTLSAPEYSCTAILLYV